MALNLGRVSTSSKKNNNASVVRTANAIGTAKSAASNKATVTKTTNAVKAANNTASKNNATSTNTKSAVKKVTTTPSKVGKSGNTVTIGTSGATATPVVSTSGANQAALETYLANELTGGNLTSTPNYDLDASSSSRQTKDPVIKRPITISPIEQPGYKYVAPVRRTGK